MILAIAFVAIIAIAIFPFGVHADSASSKALVMDALNKALVKGNPDMAPKYWAPDYLQRKPSVAGRLDGFGAAILKLQRGAKR